MTSQPVPLYTAQQVRQLDQICIERYGIPGITLMRRAGKVAFDLLRECWGQARCVHIVCGGGNNGGDGYVVAELAQAAGMEAVVWAARDPKALKGDALLAAQSYQEAGGVVFPAEEMQLDSAHVIVDALLGTGLSADVSKAYVGLLEQIKLSHKPVLAIDIPSGINADTGKVMGCAIRADATATFIGRKQGLYTADGIEYAGRVHYDSLAAPEQVYDAVSASVSLIPDKTTHGLAPRPLNSHKGLFGHVVIVGGDSGMPGAVRLAGEAALRCGAGLVTVATHPEHAKLVSMRTPELMSFAVDDFGALAELVKRATVVAIGPGLGRTDWSEQCFRAVSGSSMPAVIDADGLYWLSQTAFSSPQMLLTPHPGEAAMLLQRSGLEVQADRISAAREIAARYKATCVLKGAGTVIAEPDHAVGIYRCANPAMATAGMGDVLTGVLAALLAQGKTARDVAPSGVALHARAASAAAGHRQRGMLASDLFLELYNLVNESCVLN